MKQQSSASMSVVGMTLAFGPGFKSRLAKKVYIVFFFARSFLSLCVALSLSLSLFFSRP